MAKSHFGGIAVPLLAATVMIGCAADQRMTIPTDAGSLRARDDQRMTPGAGNNAYYTWRVSYPTGNYDPAWAEQARTEDAKVAVADTRLMTQAKGSGVLNRSSFTYVGPHPLDSGLFNFGRVGGRINAIVTHPTNAAIAWMGSDGGGVWKTTNCCGANTTWTNKTDALSIANTSIGALVLDPTNPDVIYAGTGDFRRNRPFVWGTTGLLKSIDGGETWVELGREVFFPNFQQPAGQFPQLNFISSVVVDPASPNTLAVGTSQGVYFSLDAGSTYFGPCRPGPAADQRSDITSMIGIAQTPPPPGGTNTQLWVAIGALGRVSSVRPGVERNGNNGVYTTSFAQVLGGVCPAAWTAVATQARGWPVGSSSGIPRGQPGGNNLGRIDLAVAPSDPQRVFAQAASTGVFRTSDAGATWVSTASLSDTAFDTDFVAGCVDRSFGLLFQDYNARLLVHPTDPQTVFLSSTDVWRSTDGADTFTNLTCGYDFIAQGQPGNVHVDQHSSSFVLNDPNRLLVGGDGGVYYSADAMAAQPTFDARNENTGTLEFYSGDISANFDLPTTNLRAISGGLQDNGAANLVFGAPPIAAAVWRVRAGADGIFTKIEPVLAQRWYYGSQGGGIAVSEGGPTVEGAALTSVTPVVNVGGVNRRWAGDRTGFLMPWDLFRFGDETTCPAATGCQRMLAGTYRVWESISGGLPSTSWYINSPDLTKSLSTDSNLSIINKLQHSYRDPRIAIVGTNDGNAWMGFGLGGGTANSASWVNVTGANSVLPNRPLMDVIGDPDNPLIAYAAMAGFDQNTPTTPGRVFKLTCSSSCASFNWENKTGNLPNISVNAILVNPRLPRQAFAGTDLGLYVTEDITSANPVWQKLRNGLPSAMVWDITVDRGFTTMAVFTRSRGAYLLPLPSAALTDSLFANGFE